MRARIIPGSRRLFALLGALSLFAPRPAAADNGWELVDQDAADQTGWALYSREKPDSDFDEYRITGLIAVAPRTAAEAARESFLNATYLPETQQVTILSNDGNRVVVYSRMDMPAFFADRDVVIEYLFAEESSLGTFEVRWRNLPDQGPAKPDGVVRVPKSRGRWQFAPAGAGQTLATCITHADIGGSIPAWLINQFAAGYLVRDLDKIRRLAASLP